MRWSICRTLDEYGGVFLSDVVGLGKTYMAALLAQQLPWAHARHRPAPAVRREQPGFVAERFSRFSGAASAVSVRRKLEELIRQGVDSYDNVFIDESHRFRTETTQTYERLAQMSW